MREHLAPDHGHRHGEHGDDLSHSDACAQVAATFGIPLVRTDIIKRKREDEEEEMPPQEPIRGYSDSMGMIGGGSMGGGMGGYVMPRLLDSGGSKSKKMKEAAKKVAKAGRTSSRSVMD